VQSITKKLYFLYLLVVIAIINAFFNYNNDLLNVVVILAFQIFILYGGIYSYFMNKKMFVFYPSIDYEPNNDWNQILREFAFCIYLGLFVLMFFA
jgi:hypothetical protein